MGTSKPVLPPVRVVALSLRGPSESPVGPEIAVVAEAARIIVSGGVVALPTDTLYGLAADPRNAAAVERLFQIKHRPASRPISLLISDRAMLREWVSEVTPAAARLMDAFWPGPLTLIFKGAALPDRLTAGTGTIAIRLPASPFLIRLVEAVGRPITATSANRSGGTDSRSAQQVVTTFGGEVHLVVDGGIREGPPSTLVDVTGSVPVLVRPGAVPIASLSHYLEDSLAACRTFRVKKA